VALSNDEAARVEEIIGAVAEIRARLGRWDRSFFDDIESRYAEHGANIHLSPKQWANLERIYASA
jgi:hypothetical protein